MPYIRAMPDVIDQEVKRPNAAALATSGSSDYAIEIIVKSDSGIFMRLEVLETEGFDTDHLINTGNRG